MGFDSLAEYRYAAEDLLCDCDGFRPGAMAKRDGNTTYVLDPDTGEFVIKSDRGIVTYYIPENPLAHFRGQEGVVVQ